MPRPIFKQQQKTQTQTQTQTGLRTAPAKQQQKQQQMNQLKLDRLLRQPRSKEYMEAVRKLDAGGHVHNQYKVNAILNAMQKEFPEVQLSGLIVGIISKCYLGYPYEVHVLDCVGNIIEHYKQGEPLPGVMENFRGAAYNGNYEFIEIYTDCARAVTAGGSVSVLKF